MRGKFRDLTGMIFGRWFVVGRARDYVSPKGVHLLMWACICSCGGKDCIKAVRGSDLVRGHTTNCGCVRNKKVSEANLNDLTDQRFGRLIVTSRAKNKGSGACWNCKCDCDGNIAVYRGADLVSGHTTSCGCVRREMQSGSNCNFWKNGITPVSMTIRKSTKYKNWRKAVFERDNYTCQYSGVLGKGNLVVHHIKPFAQILEENSIISTEEALECLELWDISNGTTLVEEYHNPNSKNPLSFHKIYGNYATEQDFYKWLTTKDIQCLEKYVRNGRK